MWLGPEVGTQGGCGLDRQREEVSRMRWVYTTHPGCLPSPSPSQTESRECDYNKFMSLLDTNKDCEVDFAEFLRALSCLCLYCHEYFKDCPLEPSCSQ